MGETIGSTAPAPNTPPAETGGTPPDSAAFDAAVATEQAETGEQAQTVDGAPASPPTDTADPAATPPPAAPEAPGAERATAIDTWVEQNAGERSWYAVFSATSADKVRGALDGTSSLGQLSPAEQRHLVDRATQRWSAEGNLNAARDFADRLPADATVRRDAADIYAQRATELVTPDQTTGTPGTTNLGRIYGMRAVTLAGTGPGALRDMVGRMEPQAASALPAALRAEDTARVLAELNAAPPTPAGQGFAVGTFLSLPQQQSWVGDPRHSFGAPPPLELDRGVRRELSVALGRQWNPTDPATADAQRLQGLLDSPQGRALLANERTPAMARTEALALVRTDRSITAQSLGGGDPWANPAIATPLAQMRADQFAALRGNDPIVLPGTHLENTIGSALGMRPQGVPASETPAETAARERAFAEGRHNYFATGPGSERVADIAAKIRAEAAGAVDQPGGTPRVTVIPVQFSSQDTGTVPLALFRVETANGPRFIDHEGRRYESFAAWEADNRMPPGAMTYPPGGNVTAGADGRAALETRATPRTVDTPGEYILKAADYAALGVGIVAGVVVIAGTAGLATPAVVGIAGAAGAGSAIWGASRTGADIADRAVHGQDINPLTSAEARGLWFDFTANVLGAGAFGASARLAGLARSGQAISPLAATTTGALNASANVADAAAIGNTGYTLLTNWNQLTPGQRAEMSLSMAFWGVGAAANTRAAGGRVLDAFNPIAMRDQLLATYQQPVIRDTALPGNEVRIQVDAQGRPVGIRAAEGATAADIVLHQSHAQNMLRQAGLEGRIASMLGGRQGPQPGSDAWLAQQDIAKLDTRIDQVGARLNDPTTTPAQRTQLQADIAGYRAEQQRLAQVMDGLAARGDAGFIAARSQGREQAEGIPLADGSGTVADLMNGVPNAQDYYWRVTPGGIPEIVHKGDAAATGAAAPDGTPRYAVVSDAGDPRGYRIEQLTASPFVHKATTTPPAAGAPELDLAPTLSPERRQQLSDRLEEYDRFRARRDELSDPANRARPRDDLTAAETAERNALVGRDITGASNKVGEIGAEAWVRATYGNDATLVHGGPDATSRPGDFDQVWRVEREGRVEFIVVEAKGGGAPLGAARVGGDVYQQGTPEYFDRTSASMTGEGFPQASRQVGRDLQEARETGAVDGKPATIRYLELRTGIETATAGNAPVSTAPRASAREFDLTPGSGP